MKRYPKILQIDKRGQIVIPKDIRDELGITEGTGFYAFTITEEGILLKKLPQETLDDSREVIDEIKEKSGKLGINVRNVEHAIQQYRKKPNKNRLEDVR